MFQSGTIRVHPRVDCLRLGGPYGRRRWGTRLANIRQNALKPSDLSALCWTSPLRGDRCRSAAAVLRPTVTDAFSIQRGAPCLRPAALPAPCPRPRVHPRTWRCACWRRGCRCPCSRRRWRSVRNALSPPSPSGGQAPCPCRRWSLPPAGSRGCRVKSNPPDAWNILADGRGVAHARFGMRRDGRVGTNLDLCALGERAHLRPCAQARQQHEYD